MTPVQTYSLSQISEIWHEAGVPVDMYVSQEVDMNATRETSVSVR